MGFTFKTLDGLEKFLDEPVERVHYWVTPQGQLVGIVDESDFPIGWYLTGWPTREMCRQNSHWDFQGVVMRGPYEWSDLLRLMNSRRPERFTYHCVNGKHAESIWR